MKTSHNFSAKKFFGLSALAFLIIISTFTESKSLTTINITDAKDNTLYEDITGTTSNSLGQYFFSGTTASTNLRRGLIKFDLSAIPNCATITSVTLTLHMSKSIAGAKTIQLRKVSQDWGEGTSAASGEEGFGTLAETGDATWVYSFYDTDNWGRDGGVFSTTSSASASVGTVGFYTWGSTAQMISDVQGWKDNPSVNYGWLLLGDESASATAKRFDSRQNVTASFRPVLSVTYTMNIISLNLTSIIEGFWNGTTMVSDTAKVYLRNAVSPYAIADNSKSVLNQSGNASYCLSAASSGSYYIVVKHRNSIETWSKLPESFTVGTVKNYDFTNAATKAYGNNLTLNAGKFCLYGGDIDNDGIVDATDVSFVDNDALNALSGYVQTDLTGDDFVDSADLSIVDNNSLLSVTLMRP